MKKTIIAIALVAATGTATANPSAELNRDELKDFNYLLTVSPAMADLVSGLEFGNPEKVQEALGEWSELGNKEKFLTATILNNTNIYEAEYDSVLDQLVNGGNIPDLDSAVKEAYNKFQAEGKHIGGDFHAVRESANTRAKERVGHTPKSGDLHFTATVKPVCGVRVTDAEGSLVFNNDMGSVDYASFHVRTNVEGGADLSLDTADTPINELGTISYNVNGDIIKDGKSFTGEDGDMFKVFAKSSISEESLHAGDYAVSTIVTIDCK